MGLYFSRHSKHFRFPLKGCSYLSRTEPEDNLSNYCGEILPAAEDKRERLWLASSWGSGGSRDHLPTAGTGTPPGSTPPHATPMFVRRSHAPGEFHHEGREAPVMALQVRC